MPDDHDEQLYSEEPEEAHAEVGDAEAADDEASAAAGDEVAGVGEYDDPSVGDDEAPYVPVSVHNIGVIGQLVLHYPERDVTVMLDGDAAMRMLTMFAQRRERGLADVLDPDTSSAASGWVVLDLLEPLAMSWLPGLPAKRPRTAFDPVIAAA